MTADRVNELEQRITQLEEQVGELGEVVTQSEEVKAVGLRGEPSRRSRYSPPT